MSKHSGLGFAAARMVEVTVVTTGTVTHGHMQQWPDAGPAMQSIVSLKHSKQILNMKINIINRLT